MAEYRIEFIADSSRASRTINLLEKAISDVTKEFKDAEIGSGDFIKAASNLSGLQSELRNAQREVVDLDRAYQQLSKSMASFRSGMGAKGAIPNVASPIRGTANQFGSPAYFEKLNKDLAEAIAEGKRIDAEIRQAAEERQDAINQFRSGMGAIPGVASPIRGTASQFGSPAYFEKLNKDLAEAIAEGKRIDIEIERAAQSRQNAINEFRTAMGASGRMSGSASPVRGTINQWGSPAYFEEIKRAAQSRQDAINEFRTGMGGLGVASGEASPVRGTVGQFGSPAYFEALNASLKEAIAEGTRIDAEIRRAAQERQDAINQFRSGMAERGAIPGAASPIGGAFNIKGSPLYEQVGSLAKLDRQLTGLREKARLISPDTSEWKALTKEILHTEKSIDRINKKQRGGPFAQTRLGAAGGAFLYGGGLGGGVGSALGGIAGGLMGGVPGAFTGAAVGQLVDNLGTSLAGITKQAAAVQQMQRGLALASIDAKDFAESQATVASMSQRLLMPLEQTTRLFTQLRVNTKQYNLSVADTAKIMEGTALAIMATGGSSEDLEGAMRAVVQIFSKGGVQAEELRGQLGERFPGAVVKFAQANKMSFEELQKGLENGEIGIKEFVEFAKKNYTDYAKFSEQLATAPEFAGKRLQIALEQISLEIGSLFGPMGADIQDVFTDMINSVAQFIKDNRAYMRQAIQDFTSIVGPITKVFMELMKVIANFSVAVGKVFQGLFSSIRQSLGMANLGEAKARLDKAAKAVAGKTRPTTNVRGGGPFQEYDKALAAYQALGGDAAWAKANAPAQPSNLQYGGLGAGMSLDRQGKDEKDKKAKADSLESFERLRDQLANAYNQAEIERIKARHELKKRLQEDLFDMQEFGANRLQRQNLQFLRALVKAEQDRQTTILEAQLNIAAKAGKVAPSAPILPSAGGTGVSSLTTFSSQQLTRATQEASRFTGVANMCSESVKAFYKSLGISLPGVTAWADTVRKAGQTMTDWSKLQAGDIVATGRPGDTPHVGVYTGGPNVFHQSRSRGLRAGNYPDLSYFQKQGYFVRPNVGAGMPGKVGSNQSRDTMAAAETDIARQNAKIAERGALLTKESDILKQLGRYMQETYNVPDLELDNQLLKKRNDLIEQGIDENVINYKMRLFELDLQYQGLLKAFPEFAAKAGLSEGQRIKILAILAEGLGKATQAEKAKNDETLRGIAIQRENQMQEALRFATPLGGMGLSAGFIGASGQKFEEVFKETDSKETATYFAELQNQLTLLETRNGAIQSSIMAIGDAFGTAMTTGIASLIDGTASAQEVFANFLKGIGQALLQAAQQMIATYIAIGIARIFAGLGGKNLNPTSPGGDWMSAVGRMNPTSAYADGGIAPGGFTAFANGGTVTGPTLGLVGEGRYNEAIVPLPDGRSIPVQMQGGGLREKMNNGMAGATAPPVLSMSFQSTTINGVEYVDRAQLEAAMAETRRTATSDGAKRGMTMTLDRLQNSSSTRRRVGV